MALPTLSFSAVANINLDYRFKMYQFAIPNIPVNATSEVYKLTPVPKQGALIKFRVISDSEKLRVILSTNKSIDDFRSYIVEFESAKRDYTEYNPDGIFLSFYALPASNDDFSLYVQIKNLGTVATGSVISTCIFGS